MRIRTHLNPFSHTMRFDRQQWNLVFPQFKNFLDVEIGFGYGDFMTHYAHTHPERCIVGFEINQKLSLITQRKTEEKKLINALPVWGNGLNGLKDMFEDNSIDRLFVFHPDPWMKAQHIKRRVITHAFLEVVHKKLKPGYNLYVATDVPILWEAMLKTINESGLFSLSDDREFWDTCYKTKWKERSLEKEKELHFGTFSSLRK